MENIIFHELNWNFQLSSNIAPFFTMTICKHQGFIYIPMVQHGYYNVYVVTSESLQMFTASVLDAGQRGFSYTRNKTYQS